MADSKKILHEVKQEAGKALAEAKKETVKAMEELKPAAEKAMGEVKKGVKAAQRKAAKVPEKAKDAVKKASAKREVCTPVVYVQYQGAEENVEELLAGAKAAFSAEHPRTKVSDIKLYIKPEDRAAYYVINEKFAGHIGF